MAVKRVHVENEADAREAMNGLEIRVNEGNGTLDVSSEVPRNFHDIDAGVNFEVTVPRSMNVTLKTSNGAIDLGDVSGDLSVRTTNGRIRVSNSSGTLNAATTNGAIEAQLVSVTAGKPMTFSTDERDYSQRSPSDHKKFGAQCTVGVGQRRRRTVAAKDDERIDHDSRAVIASR